jgi:hypothetical protein
LLVAASTVLTGNISAGQRIALLAPGEPFDLPDGRRAEWVQGVAREAGNEALVVTASPG